MTDMQILHDADGRVTHAVLPIDEFRRLVEAAENAADIAAYDAAISRLESGEDELVPHEVVAELVAGVHPVRVYRKHRGLTGTALAKAAGISQSYLSQIENGDRPASLKTLRALAAALKVEVDDLIPAQEAAAIRKAVDDLSTSFRDALVEVRDQVEKISVLLTKTGTSATKNIAVANKTFREVMDRLSAAKTWAPEKLAPDFDFVLTTATSTADHIAATGKLVKSTRHNDPTVERAMRQTEGNVVALFGNIDEIIKKTPGG